MKKTRTLIVLLLFALAACSAPASELITDALPGDAEPAAETSAESGEPAVEAEPAVAEEASMEVITCETADIPDPAAGAVMVRFLNLSGGEVTGMWHDMATSPGELIEYFQLEDRAVFDQETFASHEWLLKNEEGEQLLDHVASAEAKQCVTIYPHYGYEGETGPEAWAKLSDHYEVCGSRQEQSPVALADSEGTDLENIVFEYGDTAVNIINKGHTIQVKVDEGSRIVVNGKAFRLLQFHFHAPSEHTLDGASYPVEMHLVHQGEDGALAVVGVLIAKGTENLAFTPVWEHLPEEEIGTVQTGATVELASLLPVKQTTFRYQGSLTTPPCSKEVTWLVMDHAVEMSAEQIEAFTEIMSGTNRPLQPLAGRVLELDGTP